MKKTSHLARCALIAAMYAILTLVFPVLSYGPIQIRISEALCVLPFFCPEAVCGLTVGCFAANVIGVSLGVSLPWDVLIGTAATYLAAILSRRIKLPWLVPLPPVIINAAFIGTMLTLVILPGAERLPLWYNILTVGAGEIVACYALGMPIFAFIKRFMEKKDNKSDV